VETQRTQGLRGIVRDTRSALAATATLVALVALAGCGGGHSAAGPSPSTGASGSGGGGVVAAPKPLKVVSITPQKLSATRAITVNFASALSTESPLPTLKPAVPGSWARVGSTAVFTPSQAYPPDTTFTVRVAKTPSAKRKVVATRTTPSGSLLGAQEILARLHYLPLTTTAVALTSAAAEWQAVYHPPAAGFQWRYSNVPKTLKQDWSAGKNGTVLRGAVIAFQHQVGLPVDGTIGPITWHALIKADLADSVDPDHYSFVSADLHLPQTLSVWVDGHTVLTSPVNGGVAGAPTPLGTFPVYERFTAATMQGTNPDGTKYKDPAVPWINYFSGGSAVHGFPRASYGFPQSVGCLELPIPTAAKVFKLIDYGTLVNVAGPFVPPASTATPSPPASPSPSKSPKPTSSPKPSSSPTPTPTHTKSHPSK
jgi:peptidoglycan hydrolase-like protein with peptidoglycan-binding domain